LARRVKSGDPENLEAQAARYYWPALMGHKFRRDRHAADANGFLNRYMPGIRLRDRLLRCETSLTCKACFVWVNRKRVTNRRWGRVEMRWMRLKAGLFWTSYVHKGTSKNPFRLS
jgi:hypothetical protein